MRELAGTLAAWRTEGAEVGRAVVVRTFGSAPRPEGAVLLASADGRIAGSVSGGCVERAAAEEIEKARRDGRSRVIRYGISDEQAWDVGLACGGTIDVLIEPLVRAEVEAAARGSAGLDGAPASPTAGAASRPTGRGRAIIIPLPADAPGAIIGPHAPGPGEPPPASLAVGEDGLLEGTLGEPEADAELVRLAMEQLRRGASAVAEVAGRSLFIETYPVRPRLVIVGAVQAAIPLVAVARELGYATVVIDARAAFATRERFPDADRLVVAWPDDAADEIELGPADAVAILSHDVKFDEPAIVTGLQRGCWYVGAIGSRRTQAERRARLLAQGVPADDLARLRGPIGLDLGGKAPAEVALAIMAEIVALRRGGTGLPMCDRPAEPPRAVIEAAPDVP
jgi:xanthine dehydrogenase accessory factor